MKSAKLTDIPDFDLEHDLADGFLYVVDTSGESGSSRSRKIRVADLMYNASRIVKCQHCGQPTYRDKACVYCGAPPEVADDMD